MFAPKTYSSAGCNHLHHENIVERIGVTQVRIDCMDAGGLPSVFSSANKAHQMNNNLQIQQQRHRQQQQQQFQQHQLHHLQQNIGGQDHSQNHSNESAPPKRVDRFRGRFENYRRRQTDCEPRFEQTFSGICEQQNLETTVLQKASEPQRRRTKTRHNTGGEFKEQCFGDHEDRKNLTRQATSAPRNKFQLICMTMGRLTQSSIVGASEIVKRVEAALAGTEPLLTPPRSSPESDAMLVTNRDNMSLPLRKRTFTFRTIKTITAMNRRLYG